MLPSFSQRRFVPMAGRPFDSSIVQPNPPVRGLNYATTSLPPTLSSLHSSRSAFLPPLGPTSQRCLDNIFDTISLRPQLCPGCRGRKYNFTAYFHNRNLFQTPPHHLIHLVEHSYTLKNQLQSLLVTYVFHSFELRYLQDVQQRK